MPNWMWFALALFVILVAIHYIVFRDQKKSNHRLAPWNLQASQAEREANRQAALEADADLGLPSAADVFDAVSKVSDQRPTSEQVTDAMRSVGYTDTPHPLVRRHLHRLIDSGAVVRQLDRPGAPRHEQQFRYMPRS